jgi:uncharacterized protein
MFAKEPIVKGEIVAIWGGNYVSKEEAEQARASNHDVKIQQIDDDVFEVFSSETVRKDPTYFQNHSCNPNTWMEDEVTISARQLIDADEELTIDYAMFETQEDHVITEHCACGSPVCRKRVTGADWRRPELQMRYANHFSPLMNRRITVSGQEFAAPLSCNCGHPFPSLAHSRTSMRRIERRSKRYENVLNCPVGSGATRGLSES